MNHKLFSFFLAYLLCVPIHLAQLDNLRISRYSKHPSNPNFLKTSLFLHLCYSSLNALSNNTDPIQHCSRWMRYSSEYAHRAGRFSATICGICWLAIDANRFRAKRIALVAWIDNAPTLHVGRRSIYPYNTQDAAALVTHDPQNRSFRLSNCDPRIKVRFAFPRHWENADNASV